MRRGFLLNSLLSACLGGLGCAAMHSGIAPLDQTDKHTYVQVMLNGEGPFTMLVDTGSQPVELSWGAAQRLGLDVFEYLGHKQRVIGFTGDYLAGHAWLRTLEVGDAAISNVPVLVYPVLADDIHRERDRAKDPRDRPVDGVLGYEFFRHFRVTLDYPDRKLVAERGDESTPAHAVPLETIDQGLPVMKVMVNGQGPFLFSVDSGATTCVLSLEAAEKLQLQLGPEEAVETLDGQGEPVWPSALAKLEIDGVSPQNVPVRVASAENVPVRVMKMPVLARASRGDTMVLDGVLGQQFLQAYAVTIDYGEGMLTLAAPPVSPATPPVPPSAPSVQPTPAVAPVETTPPMQPTPKS